MAEQRPILNGVIPLGGRTSVSAAWWAGVLSARAGLEGWLYGLGNHHFVRMNIERSNLNELMVRSGHASTKRAHWLCLVRSLFICSKWNVDVLRWRRWLSYSEASLSASSSLLSPVRDSPALGCTFCMMSCVSSSASSGVSFRCCLAASRPWPIISPW